MGKLLKDYKDAKKRWDFGMTDWCNNVANDVGDNGISGYVTGTWNKSVEAQRVSKNSVIIAPNVSVLRTNPVFPVKGFGGDYTMAFIIGEAHTYMDAPGDNPQVTSPVEISLRRSRSLKEAMEIGDDLPF